MPIYNTLYRGAEKVKYLFIDAGCVNSMLDSLSKELLGGAAIEVDYRQLAGDYQKVFYYDCLPARKPDESEAGYQERIKPKTQLFNRLKSLDKFHVYEGTARYRKNLKEGQEQKQVDIMIAVDMLRHCVRRNMHEATLLTGDLDFKPLIDALVQEGMYVSLWYPKGRANHELLDAADSRWAFGVSNIEGWFTGSSREKFTAALPGITSEKSMPFSPGEFRENIGTAPDEGFLYEREGIYFACFQQADEYLLYQHNDLKQLKFYVEHARRPDVRR